MKKLNQQGNAVVIVLVTVILTALIAGGGVYVWQNSANKKSGQENMPATNNQVTGSQIVNSQVGELQRGSNKSRGQQVGVDSEGVAVISNSDKNRIRKKTQGKVEIVNKKNKNLIIYTNENGRKKIIAEGALNIGDGPENIKFKDVKLSPKGKYIIYTFVGYEGDGTKVYDIDNEKFVEVGGNVDKRLSLDDKYLIICGKEFPGFPMVKIYSMPEQKEVFNVFGDWHDGPDKYGTDSYDGYAIAKCDYSQLKNGIFRVHIEKEEIGKYNEPTGKIIDSKVLEYNLE